MSINAREGYILCATYVAYSVLYSYAYSLSCNKAATAVDTVAKIMPLKALVVAYWIARKVGVPVEAREGYILCAM